MDPALATVTPPSEDWQTYANRGYGAKPKPNRGKKSSISIDFNAIDASAGKHGRVILMNSPGYHSRPLLESITMWYAITGHDNPDSLERRRSARPAHLERLQVLQDAGRLLLAGPFPAIDAEDPGAAGFSGSLIVAEFSDLAAARSWAQADPYVTENVYKQVDVRPFRKVLP